MQSRVAFDSQLKIAILFLFGATLPWKIVILGLWSNWRHFYRPQFPVSVGKQPSFPNVIGSRECQLIHSCNCFDFQMCLKVLWQSTVHYQLSICSIGLSFACLWLNTRRRCAKHVREKLWARRPRAKWSPMSEREGPRPRKHGRIRKRPSNFLSMNLDGNVLG